MIPARPKVAELSFQLYGRALHPELFEIHESRTVERAGYTIRYEITSTGHVVTWQTDQQVLTEVAASSQPALPEQRRLLSNTLRGENTDAIECREGVRYQCSYQLETVKPTLFWDFQKRLTDGSADEGMLHCFDSNGRISLGAVSYLHLVARAHSVTIRALHTFPDDYAIVRTQSSLTF